MQLPEHNDKFDKERVENLRQERTLHDKKRQQREVLVTNFTKVHDGNMKKDSPFTSLGQLESQ